jgi:hypothetical protein
MHCQAQVRRRGAAAALGVAGDRDRPGGRDVAVPELLGGTQGVEHGAALDLAAAWA